MARTPPAPDRIPGPPSDDALNESPEQQLARERGDAPEMAVAERARQRQAEALHSGGVNEPEPEAKSALLSASELGFRTTSRGPSRGTYSDELDDHSVHTVDEEPLDLMQSNASVLLMKENMEVISEREFRDKAEYEAFMEQPVVIVINETSDEKAPPIVFCGVNGDGRWIPRSVPVKIQRKFVERLAQSQERHYATVPNRDTSADNAMLVRSRNVGISFHVLKDPHPRGLQWLRRVMRSGV
jgi:hypothetical protein